MMLLSEYPINPVKRYGIEPAQGGGLDIQETPFGDWVKWEDVKPREERWMLPDIYSLNVGTDDKNTGETKTTRKKCRSIRKTLHLQEVLMPWLNIAVQSLVIGALVYTIFMLLGFI